MMMIRIFIVEVCPVDCHNYLLLINFCIIFVDDLISLLDINSHGEHSVIIDSDGSVFDEDTFRISRRLGRSIANSASTAASDC
jgi:hypothetical protein